MRAFLPALGLVALAFPVLAERAAAESIRVALLPIAVHSGEPDTGYLSEGLADMLSARLERTGRVSVIRVPGASAGSDRSAAVEVANGVGAHYVLYGSFTRFGDGASLDVRCARVEAEEGSPGAQREIFIQSGSIGEIIPRLDELAEKVTRYLDGRAAPSAATAPESGGSSGGLQELQRRVEALERAVYLGDRAGSSPSPAGTDGLDVTGTVPPEGNASTVR